MANQDLLIEIGTEELPPKALSKLSKAFSAGVIAGLKEANLAHGAVQSFAAPRRLAILIEAVAQSQPDQTIERRGPALTAAFDDDGNATKAALGFAASCGVEIDALDRMETKKGAWLLFKSEQQGANAVTLFPEIVSASLSKLPIPKRMRWGAGDAEFVRPVQWIVFLYGNDVVDCEILGVNSGNQTMGHRFHCNNQLRVAQPSEYEDVLLNNGHVVADFNKRREMIREQVLEQAQKLGGEAVIHAGLLDEVTALVEWPVALAGEFEKEFLEVPQEALITTMQDNQKYFAVIDAGGNLLPHFITIANIVSKDPQQVIEGNERVIRPRFADAAFFWDVDRKNTLASRIDSLKSIVFQKKLGTLYEKTQRVAALAEKIASDIGAKPALAKRAAELSKCDLMTDMVGEFASMQGIAGKYFAQHDGEDAQVALALEQQYRPKQAGDLLPEGGVAQSLALADKIDTLVGIFGIGQKPTGAKDPFALRRASLGVLRVIIEAELDLDLQQLLDYSATLLGDKIESADTTECFNYIQDRLKAYYLDQSVAADTIDAVMSQRPTRPLDFDKRIKAVNSFRTLAEAESLAAANKRISNILKKVDGEIPSDIHTDLFQLDAERQLHQRVEALKTTANAAFDQGNYQAGLTELAALREPVDAFFDQVMVMDEDLALRENRLALLADLRGLFLRAADLSRLQ